MRDYIEIGSSPAAEDCAQLGTDTYHEEARKECRAFIAQLRRQFGPEPMSARLTIRSNPHDFGTYYEVACVFDDADEDGAEYAYRCESEAWENWDAEALRELGKSEMIVPV